MRVIGLLGGMSWESSAEYYRIINQEMRKKIGGLTSAKCIMYSMDFEEIASLQKEGKWQEATNILIDAAQGLEKAGADCVLICTNTMHIVAKEVQNNIKIPLLNIVHVVAEELRKQNLSIVGLLGTRFTMEQDFYRNILEEYGITVLIPDQNGRTIIHDVIYNELCQGKIMESSKENYLQIVEQLVKQGAQGVILGCTEIPLLLKQKDVEVPLLDTTTLHAHAAVNFSLRII